MVRVTLGRSRISNAMFNAFNVDDPKLEVYVGVSENVQYYIRPKKNWLLF